jgi:starch-binding outer membrane protein, SusD/RagB family
MKNIRIFLVFLLAISVMGCEDFLEVSPASVITSQNMWQDEAGAEAGIAGMYNRFRLAYNAGGQPDYRPLVYFELRSGFWQTGHSGASQWNDLFFNTPNSTSTPSLNWTTLYNTINAANLALKYIPQIDFFDQNKARTFMADAYFIRAFCYFTLVRVWGDVPVSVRPYESYDDDNLLPGRTPKAEVYTLIKSDIEQALSHMANDTPRNRIMANRAAINMLKTEVFLWTAKREGGGRAHLDVALTAVESVLASPSYRLLPNYLQVFRVERNDEIIFSIHFDQIEADNQYGSVFMWLGGHVDMTYRNNPVPVGTSNQWLTYNDHFINNYLLKTPGDTRAPVINQDFVAPNRTYRWVNKYLGELIGDVYYDTSDTRIYRYAEAILFRAEILNAIGRTSEAITELNKITKRAYGVDNFYPGTMTQQETDNAILHERIIEFAAELKSWYDIIRFGKAFEIIPSLVGRENEYERNILLLPISPNTLMKNLNIKQTPGF